MPPLLSFTAHAALLHDISTGGGGGEGSCTVGGGGGELVSGVQQTQPSEHPMLESPGYTPPACEHILSGFSFLVFLRHLP